MVEEGGVTEGGGSRDKKEVGRNRKKSRGWKCWYVSITSGGKEATHLFWFLTSDNFVGPITKCELEVRYKMREWFDWIQHQDNREVEIAKKLG